MTAQQQQPVWIQARAAAQRKATELVCVQLDLLKSQRVGAINLIFGTAAASKYDVLGDDQGMPALALHSCNIMQLRLVVQLYPARSNNFCDTMTNGLMCTYPARLVRDIPCRCTVAGRSDRHVLMRLLRIIRIELLRGCGDNLEIAEVPIHQQTASCHLWFCRWK